MCVYLESKLIQSYLSHEPINSTQRYSGDIAVTKLVMYVVKFGLLNSSYIVLRFLGSLPRQLQSLLIHIAQPCVFSFLAMLVLIVSSNYVLLVPVVIFLVLIIWLYYPKKNSSFAVTPTQEDLQNNADVVAAVLANVFTRNRAAYDPNDMVQEMNREIANEQKILCDTFIELENDDDDYGAVD